MVATLSNHGGQVSSPLLLSHKLHWVDQDRTIRNQFYLQTLLRTAHFYVVLYFKYQCVFLRFDLTPYKSGFQLSTVSNNAIVYFGFASLGSAIG